MELSGKGLKISLSNFAFFFQFSLMMATYEVSTDYPEETNNVDYSRFPAPCENVYVIDLIRVLQPCVYSVVFILGLVGNGLVLTIYICYRKLKSMTDMYLLNLAIADLLFIFTLPYMAASSVHGWIFGNAMCKIVQSLYSMTFYSGFLFLTCISVDRYIVIVRATLAHRLRGKTIYYSKVTCLIVWFVSILISLPQFIYSHVELEEQVCWMTYPDVANGWMKVGTLITQLVIGFLIPLLVMLFCYSIIIRTLLQARNSEKHKAFKVIMAIVVTFVVFQTPYNIISILETADTLNHSSSVCQQRSQRDITIQVTSCLAYSRCCLNPLLYAFVGVRFRSDILHLLQASGCISRTHCLKHLRSRRYTKRGSASNIETSSSFAL
uniref:C-C motif chemokine receptor 10 n=1 Tax=Callorhinchus milii TaxID=7868 RepID=A0A4W3HTD0_CALMI